MSPISAHDASHETWQDFSAGVRDQCLKTHCQSGPAVLSTDYGPDGGNSIRIETCGEGCANCIRKLLSERGPTAVTSTSRIEVAAWGEDLKSFTYPKEENAPFQYEAVTTDADAQPATNTAAI